MGADAVKLPPLPPGFKVDSFENDEIPPLPEGYTLDKEPAAEQGPRKSPAQMRQEYLQAQYGTAKTPLADAAMSIASQGVSVPASGIVGLVGSMVPGPEGQGARWAEKTREILGRVLPTEPTTPGGQVVTEGASYPFEKWGELGKYVGEKRQDMGGSPLSATLAETTLGAIPYVVSRGARGKVGEAKQALRDRMSMNAPGDETLVRGQAHGFKAMPNTTLGKTAAKSIGVGDVKKTLQAENQAVVDKIARQESGLGPKDAITRENLEAVRDALEAPYNEVARMSPTADNALQDMRNARARYKLEMDHWRVSKLPEAWDRAQAWKQKEQYYERVIDTVAQQQGNPMLLGRLKDARVRLAKNFQVEEALNEGAGIVNAKYFAARNKKTKGKELTGGLKDIANWVEAHGDTIAGKPVEMPGVGHAEAVETGLALMTGHPGWAAAIPLVRGAARRLATSKMAQPKPTGPSLGLKLGDIATRPAATGALALTPALGLKVPREESQ